MRVPEISNLYPPAVEPSPPIEISGSIQEAYAELERMRPLAEDLYVLMEDITIEVTEFDGNKVTVPFGKWSNGYMPVPTNVAELYGTEFLKKYGKTLKTLGTDMRQNSPQKVMPAKVEEALRLLVAKKIGDERIAEETEEIEGAEGTSSPATIKFMGQHLDILHQVNRQLQEKIEERVGEGFDKTV